MADSTEKSNSTKTPLDTSSIDDIINKVNAIVLDKENEVRLALCCLVAGGHLLIEDVPGVGKTTLVMAIGKCTGLDTKRIQFTVDLLPGDILGGPIFNQKEQRFDFSAGPVFTQMLLADELNRASPRTQGALLQAMEENSVSIDGENRTLPEPFFVIATQNPHQQLGTFPLPESQLDRFLMSLELNYAKHDVEAKMLQGQDPRDQVKHLKPLIDPKLFMRYREACQAVTVSDSVAEYVVRLLETSRNWKQSGALPLSTRGGLSLIKAAKAWALLAGRNYLRPDDIQDVLIPVLGHRLGGNHGIRKGRALAQELRKSTPLPT